METDESPQNYSRSVIVAGVITALLTLLVIVHYRQISGRKGTIVLPAGGTYLGPTSTPDVPKQNSTIPAVVTGGIVKGRIYPYTFTIPPSVALVTFPNDQYDIYALDINGQPPANNVLIGVDDISKKKTLLRDYIDSWWKQFDGLGGVQSLTAFTNSKGLKGYKATFTGGSQEDIFFSSPDGAYVIHLANGPLEKKVFDAIVDSVAWPARNALPEAAASLQAGSRSEAGVEE